MLFCSCILLLTSCLIVDCFMYSLFISVFIHVSIYSLQFICAYFVFMYVHI